MWNLKQGISITLPTTLNFGFGIIYQILLSVFFSIHQVEAIFIFRKNLSKIFVEFYLNFLRLKLHIFPPKSIASFKLLEAINLL